MSDTNTNPGVENGWALNATLNPKVRAMGGGSTYPVTAHHLFLPKKAVLFGATANASAAIDLHVEVSRTQAEGPEGPIEDCAGRTERYRLWLDWMDRPGSSARMMAAGHVKDQEEATKRLDQSEGKFKAVLRALGYSKEQVEDVTNIQISPQLFLGDPANPTTSFVAFYEAQLYNRETGDRRGPYWTFISRDVKDGQVDDSRGRKLLDGKTFGNLVIKDRDAALQQAGGSVPVGGSTVGTGPSLGVPGAGQGMMVPGGQPTGVIPGMAAPTNGAGVVPTAPGVALGIPNLAAAAGVN